MNQKFRFKSEERDRKVASFFALFFVLVFFVIAVLQFAGSYQQYEQGNPLETQTHFIMGAGSFLMGLAFVWVARHAARNAARCIIVDDDDPDAYFHPKGNGPNF